MRLRSETVGAMVVAVCVDRIVVLADRDDDLVPDGPPQVVLDGFDETSVGHTPANGLTWGPTAGSGGGTASRAPRASASRARATRSACGSTPASGATTRPAGGGHAHIGLLTYQGDAWPEEYRGGVFTLNLHGRRINHDRLAPRGAGYTATHAPDICFIADPWFRGTDLVAGPDGGVFIADWSDTGECHDHDGVHRTSGRIYRLVHGALRPGAAVDVAAADSSALRRHLVAGNQWWSRAAVRAWQNRSRRGVPLADDVAWLRQLGRDASDPLHRLRALWALAAIDGAAPTGAAGATRGAALDEAFLLARLDDADPFVRAWGVRLLVDGCARGGIQPTARVIDRLVSAARADLAPPVQRHLASAVGRLGDTGAWRLADALARHGDHADDPLLPNLVWYGLAAVVLGSPDAALELAAHAPDDGARLLQGLLGDRAALVDLLASRRAWAAALLDAVADGRVRTDEISAFHARQIAEFGDEPLTARLEELWGQVRVSDAERQALVARWRRELTPAAVAAADPRHGRLLFQRDCAGCHVLFGAGRKLGPDLTGSNRRNLDYLLENVIDPGASAGADFRAVSFVLADGRALVAYLTSPDQVPLP